MHPIQAFFRWFAWGMPPDHLNDGNAHYSNQNYDAAIAEYTEAIRLDPANEGVYHNRGAAWYAKLDYDRALADFNEALRLNPKFAYAYEGRAGVYLTRQNYEEAIAEYSEAVRLDPDSVTAILGRASARLAKQEANRATSVGYQLDRPVLAAPIGSPARLGYDQAIDDYTEAIRLDPHNADAYCGRAHAWHCLDDYDRAIDDFTEAIRINPGLIHVLVNRGHAWREKHRYDKAIADFEAVRQMAPHDVWATNGLAWLLGSALDANVRDGKRAVELAKEVLAADSNNAAWMDTLAVAYAETGDFAAAIRWQEQALQNAPPQFADEMRKRLELYRKQQPYRREKRRAELTQFMQRKDR